jgi:hypothetical protein
MENFPTYFARTPVHSILLWGSQSKSIQVLTDSVADECFLDATLAYELNIPTQPISTPMDVRALDVRSIGWVTHITTPINLRVSGNHSETITFLLI